MTSRWFDGDEQLLEEVGKALAEEAPGPEQAELLMAGYDLVMSDTLEAALMHDSAISAGAVRSEGGSRMVSFALGEIGLDFELVGGRIVGQLDPPEEGVMYLEQLTAADVVRNEVSPDDLGAFEFELRLPNTFRLRFVFADDGRSIATGWIDGPHETLG